MDQTLYDAAIVGGGPLGIELAVALKQAGLRYIHFEATQIGATMQWWAPGTRWFSSPERISIAGIPLVTPSQEKATREEYLAYLRAVVLQFDLEIRLYEPVDSIRRTQTHFELTTSIGGESQTYLARKVICATGGTARPHLINVPGEELPHVSHYFQDPHLYFRRQVLIVGGRNSAVEAMLRCHRAGARVVLSHYREGLDPKQIKYWLMPEAESLVRSGQVAAHFNTRPNKITRKSVNLIALDGRETMVAADHVLLMTGYEADMKLLADAGVLLQTPGDIPAYNESTMETNVAGLYVAGTAIAGTQQRYRIFLENCHVHVPRILGSLTGKPMAAPSIEYGRPES